MELPPRLTYQLEAHGKVWKVRALSSAARNDSKFIAAFVAASACLASGVFVTLLASPASGVGLMSASLAALVQIRRQHLRWESAFGKLTLGVDGVAFMNGFVPMNGIRDMTANTRRVRLRHSGGEIIWVFEHAAAAETFVMEFERRRAVYRDATRAEPVHDTVGYREVRVVGEKPTPLGRVLADKTGWSELDDELVRAVEGAEARHG